MRKQNWAEGEVELQCKPGKTSANPVLFCNKLKWLDLYTLPLSVPGCRQPRKGVSSVKQLPGAEVGPEGADHTPGCLQEGLSSAHTRFHFHSVLFIHGAVTQTISHSSIKCPHGPPQPLHFTGVQNEQSRTLILNLS